MPPARRSASRSTANTRMPGTDGGSVGTSNTGRPSPRSSAAQAPCGSAMPSTAGNATRSPRAQPRADLRDDLAAEGRVVERARVARARSTSRRASGTRSSSIARAVNPTRVSLSASSAGWKSFSARKPTTQIGSSRRRSPAAIVSGTTADGRATPTAVGSSRFSSMSPV